ncbi:MAG: DUF839 domain-containing protein, partial [Dehalococcoidia bacterium]|nr:DUF839 domain-containing protein [Dehalococcoidia bacterium]
FDDVVERFLSRRTFLQGAAGVGTLVISGAVTHATADSAKASGRLDFRPIQPDPMTADREVVAEGYRSQVLIRWGDPITADAPEWNPEALSREAQEKQFGYNCDYVGYLPLPMNSSNPDRGLLVVNHEYTNEELMFRNYSRANPTRTQIDVGIAAHGVSVVEVVRGADRRWRYVRNSPFNTRLTGFSAMLITGPAAGHPWMVTSTDPTGTVVEGTLNNCAGGKTPWGTVLTAEENFHQYFGNTGLLAANDPRRAIHQRYGLPMGESERKWERAYSRFDVSREPNEAFRFGWIVELDPYDPTWTPRKRTALGRFKHEAATFATSFNGNGRVAFYSGDDERFEYVYKFVSNGRFNPNNRMANTNLLENGILYAARFNDDGTGEWLPLVFGRGPLT